MPAAKVSPAVKLEIWDRVSETDPGHTKEVNIGRKFTAIDAHRQIYAMTKEFGPVGVGWGYSVDYHWFLESPAYVAAEVTLWTGTRDNEFGPYAGIAELRNKKGNLDNDAPKKAATGALTKLISHLGFNADVFFGLYDDNQYVAALRDKHSSDETPTDKAREEAATKAEANKVADRAWVNEQIVVGASHTEMSSFNLFKAAIKDDTMFIHIYRNNKPEYERLVAEFDAMKEAIEKEGPSDV